MAGKLYKNKYTKDDLVKVENYIGRNAIELFIEIWTDRDGDGDVYPIQVTSLASAINILLKYYDSLSSYTDRCAELIMRDKGQEFITIYHIERNREGLTYEVLRLASKRY